MNAKVEESQFRFDGLKWVVVALLVFGAAFGNSYFSSDLALLYRVLAIVAIFVLAAFVAVNTSSGNSFFELLKSSITEVKKVVWPTRQETLQTTLLVLVVVFIAAILLYLMDLGFGFVASKIIG